MTRITVVVKDGIPDEQAREIAATIQEMWDVQVELVTVEEGIVEGFPFEVS